MSEREPDPILPEPPEPETEHEWEEEPFAPTPVYPAIEPPEPWPDPDSQETPPRERPGASRRWS